jgi:hypothetical protein
MNNDDSNNNDTTVATAGRNSHDDDTLKQQHRHILEAIAPSQTSFTVNLTVRGLQFYKENVQTIESIISLQRQPENELDENAIAVYNNGTQTQHHGMLGHIAKEQAAILASFMDENTIKLENALVKEQKDTTLQITVDVTLLKEEKRTDFETLYQRISGKAKVHPKRSGSTIIDEAAVEEYASGITKQDSETAATCTIDICKLPRLPWKTNNEDDGGSTSTATWPPSPEVLEKMCVGHANDEEWWQDNAGLKPPSQWNVEGPIDLLPSIMSISRDQKERACDVLDDAVHGVTNVWSDETLEGMRDLMHSENFWSHRGAGVYIYYFILCTGHIICVNFLS